MIASLPEHEAPEQFDRSVIIEWPPAPGPGLVPSWQTRILDAESGAMITTVRRMDLHWSAEEVLWATAETLATPDGEILPEGWVCYPSPDGEGALYGVFSFLVTEMRAIWPAASFPSAPIVPVPVTADPDARTATFAGFLHPDDYTVDGSLVSIDSEHGALVRQDRFQAAVDATGVPGVTVLPAGGSSDAFRSPRPFTIAHGPWSPGGSGPGYGPENAGRDFAASRAVAAAAEARLPGAVLEVWLLPSVSFLLDYLIIPAGEWPPRRSHREKGPALPEPAP